MDAPAAEESDEDLMQRYRAGDAAAFDVLYGRHRGGIHRYILRQVRVPALAEELFQDVWFNLIRARSGYSVRAKFTTFLYRIAHNRIIDHVRRDDDAKVTRIEDDEHTALALAAVADEAHKQPEQRLDAKRQAARLLALIEQLPAPQREAFLLREEGQLSVEEIAQVTGVDKESAKSRLRYAVAKLARGMQEWR